MGEALLDRVEAPGRPRERLGRGVWIVAAAFVALELAVSARYGFHRDELYFIVAGRRAALGYVDQPPLAPLLTRVSTALFGLSPSAIRVLPALAGGCSVLVTAATARSLGGGRSAQLLAAVAVACAPVVLASAHLANTTPYDLLAWSVIVWCTLEAVLHGRRRLWVVAGLAAGLGLENNYLIVLLVASLAVGLIATGRRRALADPWLGLGVLIALALWAPNLAWQATHGWPELPMSSSLRAQHSAASDYVTVLPAELLYMGVLAVPLAIAGILRLVKDPSLRFVAVAAGLSLAFVVVQIPGRPYYPDGFLPVVFSAGAVAFEARRRGLGHLGRSVAWLVVGLALALVIILPVLPEAAWSGNAAIHNVNYDMTEQIGWPQLTAAVARVYRSLPAAERREASIFTSNYGEAGALDVYGPRYDLPPVLSGHNTYWLWGPGDAPDGVVVAVNSAWQLRSHFRSCRVAATFHSPDGVVNDENGAQIAVCTGPRGQWSSFWGDLRHYD